MLFYTVCYYIQCVILYSVLFYTVCYFIQCVILYSVLFYAVCYFIQCVILYSVLFYTVCYYIQCVILYSVLFYTVCYFIQCVILYSVLFYTVCYFIQCVILCSVLFYTVCYFIQCGGICSVLFYTAWGYIQCGGMDMLLSFPQVYLQVVFRLLDFNILHSEPLLELSTSMTRIRTVTGYGCFCCMVKWTILLSIAWCRVRVQMLLKAKPVGFNMAPQSISQPDMALIGKPASRFGFALASVGDIDQDGYQGI